MLFDDPDYCANVTRQLFAHCRAPHLKEIASMNNKQLYDKYGGVTQSRAQMFTPIMLGTIGYKELPIINAIHVMHLKAFKDEFKYCCEMYNDMRDVRHQYHIETDGGLAILIGIGLDFVLAVPGVCKSRAFNKADFERMWSKSVEGHETVPQHMQAWYRSVNLNKAKLKASINVIQLVQEGSIPNTRSCTDLHYDKLLNGK